MNPIRRIRDLWGKVVRRPRDAELDAEIQAHLDIEIDENVEAGMDPQEARYAAHRKFGNVALSKESTREVWIFAPMDRLAEDVRHTFRTITRNPMQAFLIVTTLGLAMAANLAVFSFLDKLVLRPLPVAKPNELVSIGASAFAVDGIIPKRIVAGVSRSSGRDVGGMDYPLFKALRDQVHLFEGRFFQGMLLYSGARATLDAGGDPVPVNGFLVTGNYFDLLGINAFLGRTLTPADDSESYGNAAMVLTHGFWQRQFGGDPSVLHRTIRLNQEPMVIVGITPPGFTGTGSGGNTDFFVSLTRAGTFIRFPQFTFDAPGYSIYTAMARLAPGVGIQEAEQAIRRIYQRLVAESARKSPPLTAHDRAYAARLQISLLPGGYASSLPSTLGRDMKTPLTLLMVMVALLLIVAAGNVANLLLARGTARARETAIRFALGSSRWRILRALLVESLLLSVSAAILGFFLIYWTAPLFPVLLNIPNLPAGVRTEPDLRSGLFAIGIALIIGTGIWGASAVRATKRSLLPALIENAALGGAPQATFWRRGMVALQISFSLILLCASFVLCRSLINLMSVDLGFPADNLYSFSVNYGQLGYDGARAEMLFNQITDQARTIPGVRMVSMTNSLPLLGGGGGTWVHNEVPISREEQGSLTETNTIGPGYFKTMGIPLTAGREFTPEDKAGNGKVAVVNESLARILYGTSNPIGRRLGMSIASADWEIVGLVRDMKSRSLRAPVEPSLYLPASQAPPGGQVTFVLRTAGPAVTLNAVRAAVKQVVASLPVVEFASFADRVSQSLYRDRALAMLSLCFAGLASILCAIGVFGLTSYSVAGRIKEIGVRIALGANAGSIYRLVMKEIVLLSFLGSCAGLAGFIAMSRIFTSLLFQLTPTDPASLVWAMLVLGLTTFLAGFIPSRRAARLDPSVALRWE